MVQISSYAPKQNAKYKFENMKLSVETTLLKSGKRILQTTSKSDKSNKSGCKNHQPEQKPLRLREEITLICFTAHSTSQFIKSSLTALQRINITDAHYEFPHLQLQL